ncbi:hypothetical protein HFO39_23520 [Rhizobium leguminosarum]|uniref:hypothetical protein n=1 Tax=Rhizobium leguminosarum TaxID=384 RepID=UPI001C9626EE|nr:hypothetical protein [Rhizobium leguminosarum]MBY5637701.1 hypothetical protein [Rhizobium leguminosarum]
MDVVTSISPRDESIRTAAGGRTAQNISANGAEFFNHMPATEVAALLGNRIWSSYFSFCIERNPWDKVVSMFFHRLGRRTSARTLHEFIKSGEFLQARNAELYCKDGSPIVTYIGKYEELDVSLNHAYSKIGAAYTGLNTSPKSQFRPILDNYRDHYSEDLKQDVEQAFQNEIKLHGYQF